MNLPTTLVNMSSQFKHLPPDLEVPKRLTTEEHQILINETLAKWPPKTLEEWRTVPKDEPRLDVKSARYLWNPLESFFEEQGYILFVREKDSFQIPRQPGEHRAPDPYHHYLEGQTPLSRFYCVVSGL